MKAAINLTLALLLSSATTAALGADAGFYVYGSVGQSSSDRKAQADATITGAGITAFTSRADDTDTGYKLQVGYRFNPYLAVESGHVSLGEYTYHADGTAPVAATRDASIEIDGWNVGLVLSAPVLPTFSVFAKAGALAYDLKFTCSGTGVACTNPNRSDDGTRAFYGAGLEWDLGSHWFVRAEYEVFSKIGEAFNTSGTTGTSKEDVEMVSLGIGYRF